MLCPVCKSIPINEAELENGLKCYHCDKCNGNWIRYDDYHYWAENQAEMNKPSASSSVEYMPEFDSKKAFLCPDCGRILIKFKVSNDLLFSVDHCSSCGGVWLDNKEWESLIRNGLQDKLYMFFTEPWQVQLRKDLTRKHFEESYIKRFGEEDYSKLKEIWEWIHGCKQKGEMLAYLMDNDPYGL